MPTNVNAVTYKGSRHQLSCNIRRHRTQPLEARSLRETLLYAISNKLTRPCVSFEFATWHLASAALLRRHLEGERAAVVHASPGAIELLCVDLAVLMDWNPVLAAW